MLRVLHVEDEPTTLDLVRSTLNEAGIFVDKAETLATAFALLAMDCYDIVLADLRLPDSAGAETVKKLASYGKPVVVLSGISCPETLSETAAAGADDYLLKEGLTGERLINRIRFAHSRHQKAVRRGTVKMKAEAFEALKPFISCAGSRG